MIKVWEEDRKEFEQIEKEMLSIGSKKNSSSVQPSATKNN